MASSEALLAMLTEAARSLNRHRDVGELLHAVVDLCLEAVDADTCFVYLYEQDDLVLRATSNAHPAEVGRLRMRLGEGITGWVAQQRRPVALADNASADARFKLYSNLPEDCYQAFLSVPILFRDRVLGVINLQHRAVHAHSPEEIRAVQALGLTLGEALERAAEADARHGSERRLAAVAGLQRWLAAHGPRTEAACEHLATALNVHGAVLEPLPTAAAPVVADAPGVARLPLRGRGALLGVLRLDFDPVRPPDLDLAEMLASLLATAIESDHLRASAELHAEALAQRKLIERAKGLIQQQRQLSEPDAYRWMQQQSRSSRRTMAALAQALLEEEAK